MFLWTWFGLAGSKRDQQPSSPIEELWSTINMAQGLTVMAIGMLVYSSATLVGNGRKISVGELICQELAKEVASDKLSDYLESCINQIQLDSLLAFIAFALMVGTVLILAVARSEINRLEKSL